MSEESELTTMSPSPGQLTRQRAAEATARQWLERVAYKPGWVFDVPESDPPGPVHVTGRVTLPSAVRADKTVPFYVSMSVWVDTILDGKAVVFYDLLRAAIWDGERHEADEWFKIDGLAPFYPHVFGDRYPAINRRGVLAQFLALRDYYRKAAS